MATQSAIPCRAVRPQQRHHDRTFGLGSATKVPGKPEWFAVALFNRSTFTWLLSECGIGASLTNSGRHEIRRCASSRSKFTMLLQNAATAHR